MQMFNTGLSSSSLLGLTSPSSDRPLPVSHDWSGWWYKAYLFSNEANLTGTVIYLDLDTVLCSSSLTRLFTELPPPALLATTSVTPQLTSSDSPRPGSTSFFFACLGVHALVNEGDLSLDSPTPPLL
jgi:hypothetical protein